MTLNELQINNALKEQFIEHLTNMNVIKMYSSMFQNLNKDSDAIFLTAYNKQDYLNKDRLLEIYNILNLNGTTYNQLYAQVLEYKKAKSLHELKLLLPALGADILEIIYLAPERITRLIAQQVAELQTYEYHIQNKITEETIRIYLQLTKQYLLFTCNFSKLYKDNLSIFDETLGEAINIEIAKRVVYLQKTLHQIKGTRICILDLETTGLTKPRPIQISFLLFDMNFNLIKSYDRYVKQEHIEQSATSSVHGISVQMLHNELPSVEPEEAYEEIRSLLADDKVIFIAHNANYDLRVLNNFTMQCTGEPMRQLKHICTYRDYDKFSDLKLAEHTLSSLLVHHHISEEEIVEYSNKLFQSGGSTVRFHNAAVDTTALYLFIYKSKFFTNI